MPDIQVFGLDDSPATRAAQRFFRERRVVVSYVDLRKRSLAPAELRRFVERLGARALLDETSKRLPRRGPRLPVDGRRRDRRPTARDPGLLRLPLVRHGNEVTAGAAEATWTAWLAAFKSGGGRRR